MAKFFTSQNNGVLAIMREDHAERCAEITRCGGDPLKAGVRIFTFCDEERLERNPEQRIYFTGTLKFCGMLMKGHEVSHNSSDWSYVPFSKQNYEGDKAFVTTAQDVVEVFGLVRSN